MVRQWGAVTQTATTQTHTFPLAFTSACYIVNLTQTSCGGSDQNIGVTAKTANNFTAYVDGMERRGVVYFFAVGK